MQNSKKTKKQYPILKILKTDENAVIPTKGYPTDSGFDITIISVFKKINNNVTLFDTGLKIAPSEGYYIELVARSSLMKYGYMLANNIGIIDNSYRGPILVALFKFDENSADLQLPMRIAQLIPRRIIDMKIEIQEENFELTERGEGGFGSTG